MTAFFDFETYSEAGFIWNPTINKWDSPPNAKSKGLPIVGAAVYSEHPSTEILSLAYDIGHGPRLWSPTQPLPFDLFAYINSGGILEAWNCSFERWIWENVAQIKYLFPPLPFYQLRDTMARSRAYSLPGALGNAGDVLNTENKKKKDGKRLLDKFSIPRNPTKLNLNLRTQVQDDLSDAQLLYDYNIHDIIAEAEIAARIPNLPPSELEFWYVDQLINHRGVQVDRAAILACIKIVESAHRKYNDELRQLTNDEVKAASEVARLKKWLSIRGVHLDSLTDETITEALTNPLIRPDAKRVLQIRQIIGSAAVKKLYAMLNQMTKSERLHDLFVYHSARTGRAAGAGPQPQNLPNSGPAVARCNFCDKYNRNDVKVCLRCGSTKLDFNQEWNAKAADDALSIASIGNLECLELFFGNAIETISGCLRGLFIAKPSHDLICSDYSAIEAVVLAALSGEQWRLEVFRTHGMIYEMSAAKITGIPFEEFVRHKKETGQHHIMRKKVGKVAELASGYQGFLGAWKQFGADEFFTDEEIKKSVMSWRAASPRIVEFWGGQTKHWEPCYYGLEGAAIQATFNPGTRYSYRGITYVIENNILFCELLSGRRLTYHSPRLANSSRREGTYELTYEGWNTNPKNGGIGWIRMSTYGGKLTENVVQATARDILAHAIVNLEKAGYAVVLHIHDEIVVEVPEDFGSVEEMEKIMSTLPEWARDWPIVAKGGWRAKRYSK